MTESTNTKTQAASVYGYAPMQSERRENLGVTAQSVLAAAIDFFSHRGYHGTSMREIADQVAVRPGAIYNHFSSKQDILFYLVDTWTADFFNGALEALAGIEDPSKQLETIVYHHVLFHGRHPAEMLITDNELPALIPQNRRRIIEKRKKYERLFQRILQAGMKRGQFRPEDPKLISFAIIGMCTAVATWYSPEGKLSLDTIANRYAHLVLRGVLVNPSSREG